MGKILDFIIGNTFVFVIIIAILIAILVAIIVSIVKSFNKHKIPIYEEINEDEELENVSEENIIEKPVKKDELIETKPEEKIVEEEIPVEEIPKEDSTEDIQEDVESKVEEIDEEEEQQFDDETLREELEKIDDKEIEERIDEEHKKDIEEEIKDNDNDELKEILSGMKDSNEVNPEEVVRNFEEEQEAQSIISYQELVNAVKNRENEFDDELESRPLATVSDFIKKDKKNEIEPEANVLDMIQQLDKAKKDKIEIEDVENEDTEIEDIEVLEVFEPIKDESGEKEIVVEIPEEGRFKKTDVISPVFGRIQEKNKIDYPKVEKFERRQKKTNTAVQEEVDRELIDSIVPNFSMFGAKATEAEKKKATKEMHAIKEMFEDVSKKVEQKEKKEGKAGKQDLEESDDNIESLSAISKNEDFLKALRDFRNSL